MKKDSVKSAGVSSQTLTLSQLGDKGWEMLGAGVAV